ncbi:gamma-glutamylcyclotransferase [Thiohalocapsa marina]|uniref:Gamma-glutamylcyclotransferase n=1 Tax=Thiohalocapsa marina TaxID=424902 RepID=A0A5M8FD67_9GAMM|nr:gamma-glutamylcyclotransferase [Thiohalocapsa marina]
MPTSVHARAAADERPAPAVRHLFVYGLLQSTQSLGNALDGIGHRQPARAPGRLFDLGAYPGWQPPSTPDDWVHGELLELTDPETALAEADAIEGFQGHDAEALYHRVLIRAVTANAGSALAWCYRYARPLSSRPIGDGRWTAAATLGL